MLYRQRNVFLLFFWGLFFLTAVGYAIEIQINCLPKAALKQRTAFYLLCFFMPLFSLNLMV